MNDIVPEFAPDSTPEAPELGSPMMVQYLAIKRANPELLLFYRMGDFYEMFFDDAVKASAALDIALTKRGKHEGSDIPMCGVPVHSHEAYLSRLIRKGFKVAVAEQMEDPALAKKRGGKSVVERAVVRLITPGTLTEDALLDARRHNYLAALAEAQGGLGLAWIDISTGDFQLQPLAARSVAAALARLAPGELLVSEKTLQRPDLFETWREWRSILSPLPAARFDSENARRRLETLFGVRALDAFGAFTRGELAAGGALVDYIELTQKESCRASRRRAGWPRARRWRSTPPRGAISNWSETLSGERRGSLLATIDRTVTGAGARLLAAACPRH